MADSRNKPELETLDYIPVDKQECDTCGGTGKAPVICRPLDEEIPQYVPCKDCEKGRAMSQPSKPVVEESCPIKKPLKDGQQPICGDKCTEQPNKNLMIITEIEGLMSQVNEKIHKLTFSHNTSDIAKKQTLWSQAIEEIDLFQKTTLFELRRAFE